MPQWFIELAQSREVVAAQDADAAGDEMAQDLADCLGTEVIRWRPVWDGEDWASILDLLGPEALAAGVADLLPPDDATGDLRWLRQLEIYLGSIAIPPLGDAWWAPRLAAGAAAVGRPSDVLGALEAIMAEVDGDLDRAATHALEILAQSVGAPTARSLAADVLVEHFTDPDDLSRF